MGFFKNRFGWAALIILIGLGQSLTGWAVAPDRDLDGVGNFDDYCPDTPAGGKVWTLKDLADGKAQPTWVGCSGGKDVVRAGFKPPTRPTPPPSGSKLAELETRFEAGAVEKPVEFADIDGWWTGRCYRASSPDKSIGGLLWTSSNTVDGPGFPPRRFFSIMVDSDPAHFDAMDTVLQGEVATYTSEQAAKMKENIVAGDNSLCTTQDGNSLFVRRVGVYYYAKVIREGGCTGSSGTIIGDCYFFQKVAD